MERVFRYSQTERWSDLGPLLPDLLSDVHRAVAIREDPQTLRLLSLTYWVTSGVFVLGGNVADPFVRTVL